MKITAVIFCLVVMTAFVNGAVFSVRPEIVEVDGEDSTV